MILDRVTQIHSQRQRCETTAQQTNREGWGERGGEPAESQSAEGPEAERQRQAEIPTQVSGAAMPQLSQEMPADVQPEPERETETPAEAKARKKAAKEQKKKAQEEEADAKAAAVHATVSVIAKMKWTNPTLQHRTPSFGCSQPARRLTSGAVSRPRRRDKTKGGRVLGIGC